MRPRLALVHNPLAGWNRRHPGVVTALAASEGIACRVARDPQEIGEALDELAALDPEVVIVDGGDGTVRAAVTALRRRPERFEREPVLALLRGGSTNLIQTDCGLRGSPPRALARLLVGLRNGIPAGAVRTRVPLRLRRAGDEERVEFGFFWAAGAIPKVQRSVQADYAAGRTRGVVAEARALAGSAAVLLFGDPAAHERLAPERIGWRRIGAAGGGEAAGEGRDRLFVFATTLDRLLLGFSAGGRGGEGVRVVSLRYPYARRDLPIYLLTGGRFGGAVDRACAPGFEVGVSGGWTLDGEFSDPGGATGGETVHLDALAEPCRCLT